MCYHAIFELKLQEQNDKLAGENNDNQRNGIGGGVGSGYIVGLGYADERSEGGRRGHAAADSAEVIKEGKLQSVTGEEITREHGNQRHERAVDKQHRTFLGKGFNKALSAL